jgi:hypothetical protein
MREDSGMDAAPDPAATPLPRASELHVALYAFAEASARRRIVASTLHVGVPSIEDVPITDAGEVALRAELVEAGLARVEQAEPFVWLTRLGDLAPRRDDHRWFAAAATAFATHGLRTPDFYIVTRRGWHDLATGERQVWHRVRPRRQRPDDTRPA